MLNKLKKNQFLTHIRKNRLYSRIRQYFPKPEPFYVDDQNVINSEKGKIVIIDWPAGLAKPCVGVVRDYGIYPRWTKYVRFLKNNSIPYEFYNIHASDWIEQSHKYDCVVGMPSSSPYQLDEIRRKYYFLERYLEKICYPDTDHMMIYEDKRIEAFLAKVFDFPFAKTYISYDKKEAMAMAEKLFFPVIHKIDPSSGSMGTELIPDKKAYRKLVYQVFSPNGRKTHQVYFRQKNYVYIQEMIPNSGYDIRVILVGNHAFGYYRKTPDGDFRASGMNLVEKRSLPEEAIKITARLNQVLKSPQIVVDMVHGLDGKYHIIEFSPLCRMETAAQLMVDDETGYYIIEGEKIRFEKGRVWVHELALKEFFISEYIPRIKRKHQGI